MNFFDIQVGKKYNRLDKKPVAYFCCEYALDDRSEMYAGGLGFLAGDFVLEAATQGFPLVAFGLKYKSKDPSSHYNDFVKTEVVLEVPINKEIVKVAVWKKRIKKSAHLILFDTDIHGNRIENRIITSHLYDADFGIRLKQEILLGVCGAKLLDLYKINPSRYHLNEGNGSFAALGLLVETAKKNRHIPFSDLVNLIRENIVGTKHTILSAAGLFVSETDFMNNLSCYCKTGGLVIGDVFKLGRLDRDHKIFSSTKFLIELAIRENGVSKIHTRLEKADHPESSLIAITNGVHRQRWQIPELRKGHRNINDSRFWQIRKKYRSSMDALIKKKTGISLDSNVCTLVWARRFAEYKRPHLIFTDLERLIRIVNSKKYPLQVIVSGKAHWRDLKGQAMVQRIIEYSQDSSLQGKIIYLPGYSFEESLHLVRGADIWLNTPRRGYEACGTSGMKAGLNGVLQCSVSDGWIDEVDLAGKGWKLPDKETAFALYTLLEKDILPSFYNYNAKGLPQEWLQRSRATIDLVENGFTSKRMLEDYISKLYKI